MKAFLHYQEAFLPFCTLIYKRALSGHPSSEATVRDLCAALGTTPEIQGMVMRPTIPTGKERARSHPHAAPHTASRTALLTAHTDVLVRIKAHYRSYEAFLTAHLSPSGKDSGLEYSAATYRRAFAGQYVRPSVVQEIITLAEGLPKVNAGKTPKENTHKVKPPLPQGEPGLSTECVTGRPEED
jgi:hypothetical protein